MLELDATRREHPEAGRGGRAPGLAEEPRLPHAGPRLDDDEPADAVLLPVDQAGDGGELGFSLEKLVCAKRKHWFGAFSGGGETVGF